VYRKIITFILILGVLPIDTEVLLWYDCIMSTQRLISEGDCDEATIWWMGKYSNRMKRKSNKKLRPREGKKDASTGAYQQVSTLRNAR
jgi:hypothetical protein